MAHCIECCGHAQVCRALRQLVVESWQILVLSPGSLSLFPFSLWYVPPYPCFSVTHPRFGIMVGQSKDAEHVMSWGRHG